MFTSRRPKLTLSQIHSLLPASAPPLRCLHGHPVTSKTRVQAKRHSLESAISRVFIFPGPYSDTLPRLVTSCDDSLSCAPS